MAMRTEAEQLSLLARIDAALSGEKSADLLTDQDRDRLIDRIAHAYERCKP